jgi:hypothetical protein
MKKILKGMLAWSIPAAGLGLIGFMIFAQVQRYRYRWAVVEKDGRFTFVMSGGVVVWWKDFATCEEATSERDAIRGLRERPQPPTGNAWTYKKVECK